MIVRKRGVPVTSMSVHFDCEARPTDSHGFIESANAPPALTIRSFGSYSSPFNTPGSRPLWSSSERLTILAPQLGDALLIDLTAVGSRASKEQTPFAVHVPRPPEVQTPVDLVVVAGNVAVRASR